MPALRLPSTPPGQLVPSRPPQGQARTPQEADGMLTAPHRCKGKPGQDSQELVGPGSPPWNSSTHPTTRLPCPGGKTEALPSSCGTVRAQPRLAEKAQKTRRCGLTWELSRAPQGGHWEGPQLSLPGLSAHPLQPGSSPPPNSHSLGSMQSMHLSPAPHNIQTILFSSDVPPPQVG